MIFHIDKSALLTALMKVSVGLAPYKLACKLSNGDAYTSFVCHAELDELEISAFNIVLKASTTVSIGNPIAETKDFAFRATSFLRAIKSLDGQELTIEVLEYQLIVRHSTGSFAVPLTDCSTINLPEVRDLKEFETARRLTVEAPALISVFSKCSFAMACDELRPAMNGVCMRQTKDYTDFVASDGHRLVRVRKQSITAPETVDFIFPRSLVQALLKILPKTGFAEMWYKEYIINWPEDSKEPRPACYCRIVVDGVEILSWPEKGRYPNYENVIPTSFSREFTTDRAALLKALNRLSIFANSSSQAIKFTLADGKVKLRAEDKDFETSGVEEIPAETRSGICTFGFKVHSLIQVLNNLNSATVTAKFNDPTRAFVFAPEKQPQYEDVTLLTMPLLVSDND